MSNLKIVSGKKCDVCGKGNKELITIDSEINYADLSGFTKFIAKLFKFKGVKKSYIYVSLVLVKGFVLLRKVISYGIR